MMIFARIMWLVISTIFTMQISIGRAATTAPIPVYFVNEASHGEDEYYQPIPALRGLYAHGFSDPQWSREFDGMPCKGTEQEQENLIAISSRGMSEFWFYSTRSQGILLTRRTRFSSDQPCDKALSFSYDVERAYVADGFIHSLSVDETNDMDPISSAPITHSAGQYAGSFSRIQSLMARSKPSARDRRLSVERIAGVESECYGMSGLVWHSVCRAKLWPTKGMILSAQSGDDERMMFSMQIVEVKSDVLIPGILFEVDRSWSGKVRP